MIEVEIIEPNITREENEKNIELVKEILTEIALNIEKTKTN